MTRGLYARPLLVFCGWLAVVVASLWWPLHLPPSHISPWFPIQILSLVSIPFVVSGLPTAIDPDQRIVVKGRGGGPSEVVTWPRAKGIRRAAIGFAIFLVVTLTGAIVNRSVNGPITLDGVTVASRAQRWVAQQTDSCVRAVWSGERALCQLVYRATVADRFSMRLQLVDAMCIRWMRGDDHSRSEPLQGCVRREAREGTTSLDRAVLATLDHEGGTDVVLVVELAGEATSLPPAERE